MLFRCELSRKTGEGVASTQAYHCHWTLCGGIVGSCHSLGSMVDNNTPGRLIGNHTGTSSPCVGDAGSMWMDGALGAGAGGLSFPIVDELYNVKLSCLAVHVVIVVIEGSNIPRSIVRVDVQDGSYYPQRLACRIVLK